MNAIGFARIWLDGGCAPPLIMWWVVYMVIVVSGVVALDLITGHFAGKVRLQPITQLVAELVIGRLIRIRVAKTMATLLLGLALIDFDHEFMAAFLVAPVVALCAINVMRAWWYAHAIGRGYMVGRRGSWLVVGSSSADAGFWAWFRVSPLPTATLRDS